MLYLYSGTSLGVLLIIGSLIYFAVSFQQAIVDRGSNSRVIQLSFGPLILFVSGIILLFQGWRQDPILTFKDLLMSTLMGYLVFMDLKRSNRTT
jgi:type III secretory pathway component EscS